MLRWSHQETPQPDVKHHMAKIHLILVETHGALIPAIDDILRVYVWEPILGGEVLKLCCKVPRWPPAFSGTTT